jgi:uncharacterized protein YndB with AHSA1/START domain
MIEPIRETITVPASPDKAFSAFVEALGSWWPSAYTWSGDVLETIAIEPKADGRCFERGPHNFECDWGRVLSYEPPARLAFLWQISPRREPVPDPAKSSEVEVSFIGEGDATRVELTHDQFDRHEEGAAEYREGLASEQSWPYILRCYRAAVAV